MTPGAAKTLRKWSEVWFKYVLCGPSMVMGILVLSLNLSWKFPQWQNSNKDKKLNAHDEVFYTRYPIVARALGLAAVQPLGRVRRASKGILHTRRSLAYETVLTGLLA